MLADSFPHQVELSIKHQKKTYNFKDFATATATVGEVNKENIDF